jgi:hypothetical protein
MRKLNVEVSTSADGKFAIVDVTETGKRPTQTRLPVEAIAPLIVGLLGAARSCASKTKSDGNPFEKEIGPAQELYVQANGVGLSDPPEKPELIAMTFDFGQTRLNIALSREILQPLGTALLAATADKTRSQ